MKNSEKKQKDAYSEGAEAFDTGDPCPYPNGSKEETAWECGFEDARMEE